MDLNITPSVFFRTKLGFNQYDPITNQEQSPLTKVMTVFSAEKIKLQYSATDCGVNAYFSDHKLAAKVNE